MAVQTFIDGVDVSDIVDSGISTHRLNKTWTASCRIPVRDAIDGVGKKLKIVDTDLDVDIDFHGFIKQESNEQDEDGALFTEYSAEDPREIWQWRPARDPDGDLSKPTFLEDNITGPAIMQAILTQSEDDSDPNAGEGPLFIDLAASSWAGGGADLSGVPTDWPMTIEEICDLLCSTGELDVILTPIDSGGNMAKVDAYNGNYGTDVSGSVTFSYEPGGNVKQIKRTRDMTNMCNKLYYFLGPKCDEQHWRRLITNDDPGLDSTWQGPWSHANFTTYRNSQRVDYGVRMEFRIYDDAGTGLCDAGPGDTGTVYDVPLWWRLWETESKLRVNWRTLVHVVPVEGLKPIGWDIGDLVGVESDGSYFPAFSGVQRVYERSISWDADGVVAIGEIQSSEDGDFTT